MINQKLFSHKQNKDIMNKNQGNVERLAISQKMGIKLMPNEFICFMQQLKQMDDFFCKYKESKEAVLETVEPFIDDIRDSISLTVYGIQNLAGFEMTETLFYKNQNPM